MKITLTGSLGHIGAPLAMQLIEEGHMVTVISILYLLDRLEHLTGQFFMLIHYLPNAFSCFYSCCQREISTCTFAS